MRRTSSAIILAVATIACRSALDDNAAAGTAPARAAASADRAHPPPERELDALDVRTPVPLLPMMAQHQKQSMREHLEAVQQIVAATGEGDFAAVEQAALRIGYSEQMARTCQHMGAGAHGFTERALAFHHTADAIAAAARSRDQPGILRALGATLAACTSCHAAYKQQVVRELPAPRNP